MDINLKGMFFGGQFAARQMVDQGEGGVIMAQDESAQYEEMPRSAVLTGQVVADHDHVKQVPYLAQNPGHPIDPIPRRAVDQPKDKW